MEDVWVHYDLSLRGVVFGQQVLTLEPAGNGGFLPLDSELFIGARKVKYFESQAPRWSQCSDPEVLLRKAAKKSPNGHRHVEKALRKGFEASYLAAASWYETKCIVNAAHEKREIEV